MKGVVGGTTAYCSMICTFLVLRRRKRHNPMAAPQVRKPTLLSTPTMIGTSDFLAPEFPEGVLRGLAIGVGSDPVESLPDGLTVLDENVLSANMLEVDFVMKVRGSVVNGSATASTLVMS